MGENIGAAARAMMNCGLMNLRIVAPRDGWPDKLHNRAYATASGAESVLDNVQIFETLSDATADLHFVMATTARVRHQVREVFTPTGAAEVCHARSQNGQRIGLLFGPERTGLENDDLMHANATITIPLNPDYSSLNLAQAVLLIAWEWRRTADTTPTMQLPLGNTTPAVQQDTHFFLQRLIRMLEPTGFFTSEDQKPQMILNMTTLFQRANLTDQELRTLHGILTALQSGHAS